MKFYRCPHCGNIVSKVEDKSGVLVCCGQPMIELTANTTEASLEKHIPVVAIADNIVTVTVGSVAHPMLPEHHISWILLTTNLGNQRKELKGSIPSAQFALLEGEKVVEVSEYCNLHGLWKVVL
jgi:superoxide reductase